MFRFALAFLPCCLFASSVALAQQATAAPASGLASEALALELGRVLVFVIIIESAMAAVFNWRFYRVMFGGHAIRTPIMVVVGWLVVTQFDYDIVARLLQLSIHGTDTVASTALSKILSALVIAGGSGGVFAIFARLGLRNPLAGSEPPPALDATQAWLAIHLIGENLPDSVQIALNDLGTTTRPSIAGTVSRRPFWPSVVDRLKDSFGLGNNRFPRSGGRTVKAGTDHQITLIWQAKSAGANTGHDTAASEVALDAGVYRFAPRAIVDLYLALPTGAKPQAHGGFNDQ